MPNDSVAVDGDEREMLRAGFPKLFHKVGFEGSPKRRNIQVPHRRMVAVLLGADRDGAGIHDAAFLVV